MIRWLLFAIVTSACGRIAFDPRSDSGDGAQNGDTGVDGAAPACSNWGPFSAPIHSDELATTADEYATANSEDGLLTVFDSNRGGGGSYDLWQATRTDRSLPFDAPTPLTNLNSTSNDDNPALSPDGNTLYISTNRSGSYRIWVATRGDRTQPFGTPAMLQGPITQPFTVCCPSLSADQRTIYLSVDATGTGLDYEVYEATRPDLVTDFGTPTRITQFSSSANDWAPSISSDGLELYFHTNRGINYDIMVSTRTSTADPWPAPVRLEPLSGDMYSETDPTISYSGATLSFGMFQGPGGSGNNGDIYFATRACLD